jgi:hypothetical protein
MNKSLLGSRAERFVTQKENLVSEALFIILMDQMKQTRLFVNQSMRLKTDLRED